MDLWRWVRRLILSVQSQTVFLMQKLFLILFAHSDSMDSTSFADDARICEKEGGKDNRRTTKFLNGEESQKKY